MADEPVPVVEVPEVWGPTKPPRLLLFGNRYAQNVRRRTDKRRTPIGQRIDKTSRRYWRRAMHMRTRRVAVTTGGYYFDAKVVSVDLELINARLAQHEVQRLATNSHEAKRMIEKDKQCRLAERKKAIVEDHAKRTAMGEKLRPLGVMPTRSERKAAARAMRATAKKEIRYRQLAMKMYGAIGLAEPVPSSTSSATPTDPSSET